MKPKLHVLADAFAEVVKIMYEHYKKGKSLSKKERLILKELITVQIGQIFNLKFLQTQDPELLEILKKVDGVDYNEVVSEEINEMKADMEAMFKSQGLDVDLSGINAADDQEEIFRKISDAMFAAKEAQEQLEDNFSKKPKSKKEIEQEDKEKKLEIIQKLSLSVIYKQLAKAFHPDLEQDPDKKIDKEKLMKKLTSAYENKDLHTLLQLEMELMSRSENPQKEQTEEQLKMYNTILKEQIIALEHEIKMSANHQKYLPLKQFLEEARTPRDCMFQLVIYNKEINEELAITHEDLNILKNGNALKRLRSMIGFKAKANEFSFFD